MEHLHQSFTIKFEYNVYFTTGLFDTANTLFSDFLLKNNTAEVQRKIFFVVDSGVAEAHPELNTQLKDYFYAHPGIQLIPDILIVPGGEGVKNDPIYFEQVVEAVNTYGIDRHSYIAAIGGGSVLDMVGYAAAVSHRGIKHIRIPTTVLSQNDSGIGVKNGINYFGKKNFLGTFAPPVVVFNDDSFLLTLSDRDWRSGISEAIKVALIKDAEFFTWLENNAALLVQRDMPTMNYLVWRCAQLHIEHIASKDPFESGSSRPLDFGHWSAHKLEYLSNFEVRHGEAVAMGIALDTVYSQLSGRLSVNDSNRVIKLLQNLGFDIIHPLLEVHRDDSPILTGFEEFREHLGGQLTIMLLTAIGVGEEVHEVDVELLKQAGKLLHNLQHQQVQ
ncbi:3-dehydroquinate synthase [Mucilaginibacter limnophilus]|uniref:3-dehydroquinate synthase n=1 Tax=Mucilaginibacter limnophilus TaxID=1932778 RepID=A0A437MRS4_9SPHI|nr:3-dehydroquinate synthase [Mucilaginibacter limnophilus]RVU00350.1 3-dehydroquinate synthase [Mucilaginibacter limnophilus]